MPEDPVWGYEDLALFVSAVLPAGLLAALPLRLAGITGRAGRTLLFQSLVYLLLLAALYALISLRHRQPFWRSLGWSWPVRGARICVLAAPALAIASSLLGVVLHAPEVPDPIRGLITSRASLLLVLLFVVVFGPVFEELVFRGFLFPLLAKSFGAAAGIVLTALPFALLHGAQNQWAWQQVSLIAVAGIAFGYARHKTGSTAAATILHCLYNLTGAAGYLIQQWAQGTL